MRLSSPFPMPVGNPFSGSVDVRLFYTSVRHVCCLILVSVYLIWTKIDVLMIRALSFYHTSFTFWQVAFSLPLITSAPGRSSPLCAPTSSVSCLTEEITSKSREHSHRIGYYQRNDNEMFSLVSQKVMAQPPSANKKKQYEIRDVLGSRDLLVWKSHGTCESLSGVYTLKQYFKYITNPTS